MNRTALTVVAAAMVVSTAAAMALIAHSPEPAATGEKQQDGSVSAPEKAPGHVSSVLVRHGTEAGGKSVSITLDDGPHPQWTPQALAVLEENGVKAVFCITGRDAERYPDLVRQIVASGHRLCNHSVNHNMAMDKEGLAYQTKEILDAKRMIETASGGERLWYYRAPGGAFTPESREVAAMHGMASLGWSVDPSDYRARDAQMILQTVKMQLRNGSVILLHDGGGNRSHTVQALRELLPLLKAEGYTFSFPKGPDAT
ncbi:polysaccharide deacetylase family protein [Streptomyces sp. H27-H1]|uniref:polysaccharide deacetylase family protein n=1 Tax=Streptomyces sp. H27-H1 TaxID=2996461 RepID=UPI00226D5FD5|nr:polysaccharide deacetylase family protein [Streptomyces sp. H27-H1]MCY0932559.1 polysaccharide deacetylase family protein [Streptomyces sp. H27-H1]